MFMQKIFYVPYSAAVRLFNTYYKTTSSGLFVPIMKLTHCSGSMPCPKTQALFNRLVLNTHAFAPPSMLGYSWEHLLSLMKGKRPFANAVVPFELKLGPKYLFPLNLFH